MRIKLIAAGAAIALAASIGTASAAEQFSTLEGVTAVAMSTGELGAVTGTAKHFEVTLPTGEIITGLTAYFTAAGFGETNGPLAPLSFQDGHMQNAEGASGVIDVCGFGAGCI